MLCYVFNTSLIPCWKFYFALTGLKKTKTTKTWTLNDMERKSSTYSISLSQTINTYTLSLSFFSLSLSPPPTHTHISMHNSVPKCTIITVLQGPFSVRLSNSNKNWEFPSPKQHYQRQIAENKLTPWVVAQGVNNPSDQVHRTCSCGDFLHKHTSRSMGDWKTKAYVPSFYKHINGAKHPTKF